VWDSADQAKFKKLWEIIKGMSGKCDKDYKATVYEQPNTDSPATLGNLFFEPWRYTVAPPAFDPNSGRLNAIPANPCYAEAPKCQWDGQECGISKKSAETFCASLPLGGFDPRCVGVCKADFGASNNQCPVCKYSEDPGDLLDLADQTTDVFWKLKLASGDSTKSHCLKANALEKAIQGWRQTLLVNLQLKRKSFEADHSSDIVKTLFDGNSGGSESVDTQLLNLADADFIRNDGVETEGRAGYGGFEAPVNLNDKLVADTGPARSNIAYAPLNLFKATEHGKVEKYDAFRPRNAQYWDDETTSIFRKALTGTDLTGSQSRMRERFRGLGTELHGRTTAFFSLGDYAYERLSSVAQDEQSDKYDSFYGDKGAFAGVQGAKLGEPLEQDKLMGTTGNKPALSEIAKISFAGGGALYSYSAIAVSVESYEYSWDSESAAATSVDGAIHGELFVVMLELGMGHTWEMSLNVGGGVESSQTRHVEIAYTLGDEDSGDSFDIEVGIDPVYATPVFRVLGGASSCPHEPFTVDREGVELVRPGKIMIRNVPERESVVFNLGLRPTAVSENDAQVYTIVMDSVSNLDGLQVYAAGTSLNGGSVLNGHDIILGDDIDYTAYQDPTEQQELMEKTIPLEIFRGPQKYKYENVVIHALSKCEVGMDYMYWSTLQAFETDPKNEQDPKFGYCLQGEIDKCTATELEAQWRTGAYRDTSSMALNVEFVEDCPKVEWAGKILREQNFLINGDQENKIEVALRNPAFPTSSWKCEEGETGCRVNDRIEAIYFQYRKKGGSESDWVGATVMDATSTLLAQRDITELADTYGYLEFLFGFPLTYVTEDMSEGEYDVRGMIKCDSRNPKSTESYTSLIDGWIDLKPPSLMYAPTPVDTFDPTGATAGGEISITFEEELNCQKPYTFHMVGNLAEGKWKDSIEKVKLSPYCYGNKIWFQITLNGDGGKSSGEMEITVSNIQDLRKNRYKNEDGKDELKWTFKIAKASLLQTASMAARVPPAPKINTSLFDDSTQMGQMLSLLQRQQQTLAVLMSRTQQAERTAASVAAHRGPDGKSIVIGHVPSFVQTGEDAHIALKIRVAEEDQESPHGVNKYSHRPVGRRERLEFDREVRPPEEADDWEAVGKASELLSKGDVGAAALNMEGGMEDEDIGADGGEGGGGGGSGDSAEEDEEEDEEDDEDDDEHDEKKEEKKEKKEEKRDEDDEKEGGE